LQKVEVLDVAAISQSARTARLARRQRNVNVCGRVGAGPVAKG
jgi:hypothetical protein